MIAVVFIMAAGVYLLLMLNHLDLRRDNRKLLADGVPYDAHCPAAVRANPLLLRQCISMTSTGSEDMSSSSLPVLLRRV
jgi:hypothetical protein